MVLTKLFQSIGIPITARNFMVDYCDSHGNHFHKPMQPSRRRNAWRMIWR